MLMPSAFGSISFWISTKREDSDGSEQRDECRYQRAPELRPGSEKDGCKVESYHYTQENGHSSGTYRKWKRPHGDFSSDGFILCYRASCRHSPPIVLDKLLNSLRRPRTPALAPPASPAFWSVAKSRGALSVLSSLLPSMNTVESAVSREGCCWTIPVVLIDRWTDVGNSQWV